MQKKVAPALPSGLMTDTLDLSPVTTIMAKPPKRVQNVHGSVGDDYPAELRSFYECLNGLTDAQKSALRQLGITRHIRWQWSSGKRLPTIEQASVFAAACGMNAHQLFDALALVRARIKLDRKKGKGQGLLFGLVVLIACGLSPGTAAVTTSAVQLQLNTAFRATLSTGYDLARSRPRGRGLRRASVLDAAAR